MPVEVFVKRRPRNFCYLSCFSYQNMAATVQSLLSCPFPYRFYSL